MVHPQQKANYDPLKKNENYDKLKKGEIMTYSITESSKDLFFFPHADRAP